MIELAQGNLLEATADALVNTVNTVGVMGKGIALQFKKAFPENFRSYRAACNRGEVTPGKMFVFDRGRLDGPRYVINFPTKRHWREPSRLEDVRTGLEDLAEIVERLGIRSVAVPPLGCGNGGLSWAKVEPLIRRRLERLPSVRVLLFPPQSAPVAETMPDRRVPQTLSPVRAAIIRLIDGYKKFGIYRMSLVEVQKLAYFLQEAGEPMRLRFVKDKYGPYADQLRRVLVEMDGHFIAGIGDATGGARTLVTLQPGAVEEAEAVLRRNKTSDGRYRRVNDLLEGFETAEGLELLATVHWVATHDGCGTIKLAANAVHEWNARKRDIFSRAQIGAAWRRLSELGWLSC